MASTKKAKLTIAIVTHNSSSVIHDCLEKIANCDFPIIIVDCNSTDAGVTEIEKQYPNIRIIASPQNLGYGRANNLGAKHADSDYILFLNPDAIIDIANINLALEALEQNPKIGVAGVQIKGEEGYEGEKDGDLLYKSWILGAVFFIRTKLFNQLKGFDENIFMYGDETDLCSRVAQAGYKNAVVLNASATHINRGSTPQKWHYDYLRGYHNCWSKLYLRNKRKGLFKTSYIVPKFIFKSSFLFLLSVITLDKPKIFWHLGGASGSISYMLGQKAFNKNDNPRGFIKK